jgi:hypothetical protein
MIETMTKPQIIDTDFLDKIVSGHSRSAEVYEGLCIMNNNSFFSTVADAKPYKLVSSILGTLLAYNTILKLTSEEAKYLHEKHKIKHLLGWTIK